MTKTTLAAAFAVMITAAPAFAAEEYQSGPALVLTDHVPASDTGSSQTPAFNGQAVMVSPRLRLVSGNASESAVESVSSQTVALGTDTATIGIFVAQR